jgi:MSHA pilin protein MshA
LRGTLQSAAALAHSQWLAQGSTGTSVTMEGVTVTLDANGWPLADNTGISRAINLSAGDFTDDTAGTFSIPGRTNCEVVYALSGTASPPGATITSTGC